VPSATATEANRPTPAVVEPMSTVSTQQNAAVGGQATQPPPHFTSPAAQAVATQRLASQAVSTTPPLGHALHTPSQRRYPGAHAVATQAVPEHVVWVTPPVGQLAQAPPQDAAPGTQVYWHALPSQLAVAFACAGHGVQLWPQLSAESFDTHRSLQTWNPLAQAQLWVSTSHEAFSPQSPSLPQPARHAPESRSQNVFPVQPVTVHRWPASVLGTVSPELPESPPDPAPAPPQATSAPATMQQMRRGAGRTVRALSGRRDAQRAPRTRHSR